MKDKGKIYYVCFYFDEDVESKIVTYPSVLPKIDYIVSKLKDLEQQVVVLSVAPSIKGYFSGFKKEIDERETHYYLPSKTSGNRWLRRIETFFQGRKILKFLKNEVKENDVVLVYHSLYHRKWLKTYKKCLKKKFVLEIEDVYSSLSLKTKRFKQEEWGLFQLADACICINDIVYRELPNISNKVVSYGSYFLPLQHKKNKSDKITLVYAGVIEQERRAAFLAVEAMKYLPNLYRLDILGFGDENDISALQKLIRLINSEKSEELITYYGKKSGGEYYRHLQQCDIALSLHAYDDRNIQSSNHTFPSKILVYLANNLRVVAQELDVLKQSSVGNFIKFYKEPNAVLIAETIKGIDISQPYDSRKAIEELDKEFERDLKKMLLMLKN